MKKIIIFILSFWPCLVGAWTVDNYYMNITIAENGDIYVENILNTPKKLDYLEMNIPDSANTDIITVGSLPLASKYDFSSLGVKEFLKVNKATTNDADIYLSFKEDNTMKLRIYNQSQNAYYLKYILKNAAYKHNDLGEVNLALLKDFNYSIDNLYININIAKNNLIYYENTLPQGKIKTNKNNSFQLHYHHLKEGDNLNVRIFFEKDLIKDSNNLTNEDAAPVVKALKEQNNHQVTFIFKILNKMVSILTIIALGILNYLMSKIIILDSLQDKKEIKYLLGQKNSLIELILGLLIIMFLLKYFIFYVVIFLLSIIYYSDFLKKNKKNLKIVYLLTSYLLLDCISFLNIIFSRNIINYLIFLLINLSIVNIGYHLQRLHYPLKTSKDSKIA